MKSSNSCPMSHRCSGRSITPRQLHWPCQKWQVPVPPDCAWLNRATARKAPGPHQPDMLWELRLGWNYAVQPRTRVAAAMEIKLRISLLAILRAGHASIPPMSSGFRLGLSLCLIIHIHPFVRVPELLINLIIQVMHRKLLHPKVFHQKSRFQDPRFWGVQL